MPFIPTRNTHPEVKQRCIKCHNRRESYVYCSLSCSACLCKKCYDACPIYDVSTIVPADHVIDGTDAEDYEGIDDDNDDNDSLALSSVGRSDDEIDDDDDVDDTNCDEVNEQHDTRDDDFAYSDELLDDNHFEPDFLFYNDSNATHDITPDNVVHDQGFVTTNWGDSIHDVTHHDRMERVSGHVLLNQAAVCLRRFRRAPISGTQVQRHFIQCLASSIPGESNPLIYMESSLFTWIFYHSSSNDRFSMLGATLFVYGTIKTNPFGLDSFVGMNRSCVTNYGSLSSSCVPYINFLYDVMCKKALCHSDSHKVTKHGFVADTKSATGLSIRNKGESSLSDSTNSHQMVRSLSASQEFDKYDMFLTFTCGQKDFPGTRNLFQ